MARSPRCDPSDEMAMGMMDIEDIELFLANIVRETLNIAEVLPKKGGMIDLQGMVQLKSIRGLHARLPDSLFDAILYAKTTSCPLLSSPLQRLTTGSAGPVHFQLLKS